MRKSEPVDKLGLVTLFFQLKREVYRLFDIGIASSA
jgi:hypothetical protein